MIGLDIGGSTTRGVLFRGGSPVCEARAGSANVQNVPEAVALAAVQEVITSLHPGPKVSVVAGSGGVDTPADVARLTSLIRRAGSLPDAAPVTCVHDTRLILAAGGYTAGIAVVMGTGSVAWGVDASGRELRSGGWGYLLGDEGSGYWLGREAVRRIITQAQLHPEQPLAQWENQVLQHAGVTAPLDLIAAFHDRPDRTHWAKVSRYVTDAARDGDPGAVGLVEAAAQHLRRMILDVAHGLGMDLPVVLGGGLAHTVVGELLITALHQDGLTRVAPLEQEPVMGTPLLAQQAEIR